MGPQSVSIEELKQLVSFGLSSGELVVGLANGFSFDDVQKALEVVKKAPALKLAGVALTQYREMTDEQASALEAFVITDFDIPADSVETVIEAVLAFLIGLHGFVDMLLPKLNAAKQVVS
jgi:hypothetical protein